MEFNILYFAMVGAGFGGVEQKVIAQYDALSKKNNRTYLYLVSSSIPNQTFGKEIRKRENVNILVNSINKLNNPYSRRKEKFQLVSDALKNYSPDNTVVYFRYPDSDLLFYNFLKAHQEFTFVTEHQEIENTFWNFQPDGRQFNNILEIFYGKKVRREISAFVGVTPEITNFELKVCRQSNKKALTLGNGINVLKYPVRSLNPHNPEKIKLLFVGGGLRRHGLDRILQGIYQYQQLPDKQYKILLRIAGESKDLEDDKTLVQKLKLQDFVEFLGNKSPEDLDEHFDWADLGVGGLGFHRIGLTYTSNLKAREYFSRGLPFFSSTIDLDLENGSRYVLNFPSEETSIDIGAVVDFALKMRADARHPSDMRTYAINYLDWNIKMDILFGFLESLRTLQPLQDATKKRAKATAGSDQN